MYIDQIAVINFYSFVNINEPDILVPKLLLVAKKKGIRGTILLAKEGFNGGISGSKENVDLLLEHITELTKADYVNVKVNYTSAHPFSKFKVKLKKEIVTMGIENLDVNHYKGKYIEPKDWDDFVNRENVVLVDTRNDYEVSVGTFDKALDPMTDTFRQFPDWVKSHSDHLKDKVIAMFCTGGIRCEKSTAYLKTLGYKEVYHLKGGILQYLEDTKNKNAKWKGECFVFDDRRGVDDNLAPTHIE